jgi:hypothetical protein
MADAPETTGVPPMDLHPPVPIVVDRFALHKRHPDATIGKPELLL